MAVARAVPAGAPDITNGALFFHAAGAKPGWFKPRPKVGLIGGNIFLSLSRPAGPASRPASRPGQAAGTMTWMR